ncbi:MAG: flagellar hook-basal body complex protein FliE [Planctomycetes bacterium]|nr:flagellar hook-basal body complex protein FliE [Planctomycetota bacterium]
MVDRIGTGSSSLARVAIEAAMKRQADAMRSMSAGPEGPSAPRTSDFAKSIGDSLRAVDEQVKRVDELSKDLISGNVADLSAVAAQLKESDLSLRFALEVRNKFIDAYREVMRMSV